MNETQPFFVFGLGNPGRRFRGYRHNIGFMVLDKLADRFEVLFDKVQFNCLISKVKYGENRIFLGKPQTFMNLSGDSVVPLLRYYRVPLEQTLIIFDDLDLPLGQIRMRPQGGSGGHKGMQSIIEKLASEAIPRMRLGIGRPPGRMEASAFVLQSFSEDELELVELVVDKAVSATTSLIDEGIESAMNRFNPKPEV